jgi:hypothetical protein
MFLHASHVISRWLVGALCSIAAFAAGCTPGAATPSPSGHCWVVVPLTLEVLSGGSTWKPIVWLDAAGELHHSKRREPFGRLAADRADLGDGNMMCHADGVVKIPGSESDARYGSDDALELGTARIFVADDGEVAFRQGERDMLGERTKGKVRVTGDVKKARRTAELMVLLAIAGPPR